MVSGPAFVDLGADRVTLKAVTEIAVACSVVYGETPAYGSIATDTDMAGGGHTDHHPVLAGLKPDTLYRSEALTSRTMAAVAASGPLNRALPAHGAQVTGVSSNFGGGADDATWGALSAIDGSGATAWSSNRDGDEA